MLLCSSTVVTGSSHVRHRAIACMTYCRMRKEATSMGGGVRTASWRSARDTKKGNVSGGDDQCEASESAVPAGNC
jgi:hypothetical protein